MYFFLRKEKPQIIHSHTPKAGLISMMAAFFARVPIRIHTVAGLPLLEAVGMKRVLLNFVEKLTYNMATKVYPNSFGLRDIIYEQNYAPIEKVKVLGRGSSNGIDTDYFDPELFDSFQNAKKRKSLNIEQNTFVLIFVGRIVKDKGINELLWVFDQISKENHNCKLLLIGSFEKDLDPISKESESILKNNNKILSIGYKQDVRPYFAISNLLCFPSYREGFPNVVLQAGAMNVPAIVSNINGCNEIIKDHENGLIIQVKDKKALHDAILSVILSRSEGVEQFKNMRNVITENYSQQFIWKEILNEYNYLLEKENV